MEHGGGERFKVGWPRVRDPQALARRRRARSRAPRTPTVTTLEVWPPHRVMVPGETAADSLVTATWSDGRRRGRHRARPSSTRSTTPSPPSRPDGLVTAKARGETHVMIRFCGQATVVQVTLPLREDRQAIPTLPRNNFIDEKLIAKWKDLGLTPSPLCSDEEFFRRIHLDAIGTLPTPDEMQGVPRRQVAGQAARRRSTRCSTGRSSSISGRSSGATCCASTATACSDKGMWSFHNWVRGQPARQQAGRRDRPRHHHRRGQHLHRRPGQLLHASAATPADWAETTAQLFLGVRMQCAKCHHHPFEKWSQDDYYGMAAFFARLGTKNSQEFGLFGRETVVYLQARPASRRIRARAASSSRTRSTAPDMDDPFDRRGKLAEWLTAPDNPFFARNIVNRFWGYLMGRGLVEPLDDMRATNPASNPELLDALAEDFVEHKFDLKHLLRTIMNSRAYQLSSIDDAGQRGRRGQRPLHAATRRKRLTAEQTGRRHRLRHRHAEKYPGLPLGTRAIQLPDTRVQSYLLDVFGRPPRQITCECERTDAAEHRPGAAPAQRRLPQQEDRRPDGPDRDAAQGEEADRRRSSRSCTWSTLSRSPRDEEVTQGAASWIGAAQDTREGLQDLLWVLLNSREFLFNH